jgi:hypothetical protein
MIVHLMTQRDQPFGSVRKCCEVCGEIPNKLFTDDPEIFKVIQKTGEVEGVKYEACTNPFQGKG